MNNAGNRFEGYVDEMHRSHERQTAQQRLRQQEYAAASDLAQINAEELANLNTQRRDTNEGHRPVDLWGEEAAELCNEFLAYAEKASRGTSRLLGATGLRGLDPRETYTAYEGVFKKKPVRRSRVTGVGWRSSGYPIAYSDPQIRSDIIRDRQGSVEDPIKVPPMDIFLCDDGLIRHDNHPLDLTDLNGATKKPKFVRWNRAHTEDSRTHCYFDGHSDVTKVLTTHTFGLSFTELNPLQGLDKRLKELAISIDEGIDS